MRKNPTLTFTFDEVDVVLNPKLLLHRGASSSPVSFVLDEEEADIFFRNDNKFSIQYILISTDSILPGLLNELNVNSWIFGFLKNKFFADPLLLTCLTVALKF